MLDPVGVLANEQYKKLLADTDKIRDGLVRAECGYHSRTEAARKLAEAKLPIHDPLDDAVHQQPRVIVEPIGDLNITCIFKAPSGEIRLLESPNPSPNQNEEIARIRYVIYVWTRSLARSVMARYTCEKRTHLHH